jgi:type I restriction enzyme S subunit
MSQEGWQVVRAKHLYRVVDDRAGDRRPPLLSVSIHHGVVPRSSLTEDEHRADDLSAYKTCEAGDIVLNRMRAFQGAIGISPSRGLVSPDYLVLRPEPSVDARYIHHLFRSRWFISEMAARLRGIGAVDQGNVRTPRINSEDLGLIPLAVPRLAEQRAIADFLDGETARLDALVAAKRRMIELLAEQMRAHRQHVVLNGVDPLALNCESGGPWPVANLGTIVGLQRGHDLPTESRTEGAVPVVSSGGISGFHGIAACEPPGVVTGRYGTIGEVFFVDVPYWPLNTTLYVQDFRGNEPRWVFHLLASLPLSFDAEKSAVTGINRNVIGCLRVPVPPCDEQRRMAAVVDHNMALSEAIGQRLTRQIDLLVEHRQSLITTAVTGGPYIRGLSS